MSVQLWLVSLEDQSSKTCPTESGVTHRCGLCEDLANLKSATFLDR